MRYFLNIYPDGFVYTGLRFYTTWYGNGRYYGRQHMGADAGGRGIPGIAALACRYGLLNSTSDLKVSLGSSDTVTTPLTSIVATPSGA